MRDEIDFKPLIDLENQQRSPIIKSRDESKIQKFLKCQIKTTQNKIVHILSSMRSSVFRKLTAT